MLQGMSKPKPRILLLVDRPGWAFDAAAKSVATRLENEFEFKIFYVSESPDLHRWPCDLIHVFFWGETYHRDFITDNCKVIKEISSHRWENEPQYGLLSETDMASTFLRDAATVTTTSLRLYDRFSSVREVLFTPNGIDSNCFYDKESRSGPLRIGWAGNIDDPCKGIKDIILPAAGREYQLLLAPGDRSREEMLEFYNAIDVLCIASTFEGEPLTLIEAMACGCFPVAVDVGIVPELVGHLQNGLIISRGIDSFKAAFAWCSSNLDRVRRAGRSNAQIIRSTRTWVKTIPFWRAAFRCALRKSVSTISDLALVRSDPVKDATWHNNLGDTLLEWPERAQAAGRLLGSLPLSKGDTVIDLGAGHQTLRRLIPTFLRYVPVDRVSRGPDTIVMDLERHMPHGEYTVATMLGLLEYLRDPVRVFSWLAHHARYCVFSFSDCTNEQKRKAQHWQSSLSFEEIEDLVRRVGGKILQADQYVDRARIYLAEFRADRTASASSKAFSLALLSSGLNGTNCGDALIEDSIRRILSPCRMSSFPLLKQLSESQIEQINECDAAVICGTNLYQTTFACALTSDVIEKIKVPILPLGVGTSAPIGEMPRMDADGVRATRMLHDRCAVSSVRDPASLSFIRRLGISNVALTGCPVLFHALKEPQFTANDGEGLYVSVRARLLHVDQGLVARKMETLERLIKAFKPVLVLASPHDVPLAQPLVERYGLQYLLDDRYTHLPFVIGVRNAARTAGFRLHFAMLSLAYGKHTTLVGTDTRVSEFCGMMGLNYHDIKSYSDDAVIEELTSPPPSMDSFLCSWRDLRAEMASVLDANGIAHTLNR